MIKKILFLLTFLLVTTGGSKLWAETDDIDLNPFSSGEVSAKAFTRTGSLFSVSVTGCKYLDSNTFQLGDGTQFVITPSNSNVKVLSIGFTNIGTGQTTSATCSINGASVTKDVFINKKGNANSPETCTWDNNTDKTSFTIVFGKSGDDPWAKITSITITYQVMYRGSMPYTWNFNSWPLTTSSMMTANGNAKWTTSGYDYFYKLTPSGEALVDGNNDAISETSGLTFTATAGNIWTDLNTGVGLKNNASVTIPAKTGQKIAVYAYWHAETMTLENATENTSNAYTFEPTSAGADTYYFTATAHNVTLRANTNDLYIYSIAVTKNDLTTFVVSNDDNYYYGGTSGATSFSPYTTFTYNPTYTGSHYIRTSVNMNINTTSLTAADFEITSSDETVLDPTGFGKVGASETGTPGIYKFIFNGIEAKKPGTATLTIKYKGSDVYNEITCQETFTFAKATPTIAFEKAGNQTEDYSTSTYTNVASESTTYGRTITYSSSDEHVATVNASGVVTYVNSGVTTITATAVGDDYYNQASASYKLTLNATETAPTIMMTQNPGTSQPVGVADGGTVTTTFGNTVTVQGTCDPSGPTVKYRSSNESVATVDGSGAVTTKKGGEVVITVYTDSYQGYPAASVSYNLHINPALFDFKFKPYNEGTINVGATITPQMTIPTLMFEDVTSITASSSNSSVASVPENLLQYPYLDVADGRINRIKPVITGVAVGDATITVNFMSKNYTSSSATYTVHVVAAGTRNFSWADGSGNPTYTIYEGDYMMLPKITGNSNGNDNYSRGSNKKYVYKIEGSTTTLNTTDYRIHEGVPDIMVVEGETETTNGSHAIVFFAKGQGTTFPDTLMIYGKAAGNVLLRAKDPQNGLFCDATIKIIPTTTLRSDSTNYVKNMSFPYTWDFTGNFDMTDIAANPHYWVAHSGYYAAGDGFFNVDWADRTNNGSSTNLYFKDFVAGNGDGTNTAGKYMPQFYGLQMMLQSSLYSPKIDRVQIKNYNDGNPGAPRFVISGGPTHLKLPKAPTQPDSYRIYMKIHTKGDTEVGLGLSTAPIKKYAVESGKYSTNCQLTANTDAIIFFDVDNTTSDNEGTIIYLSNTSIYWIATSTEAKSITQPGNMPYPAATYCYGKDLDFTLSKDANNSTFGTTSGSNLTAWYASAFDNTTKTVTMTQVTEPIAQEQGVFLKTATGKTGDYYMISKAENTASPAAGTNVSSTNMLKPLMTSQDVSRFDKDGSGDITHTNFFLNYRYKNYDNHNIEGDAIGDYNLPYSWRFYRIHNTVTGSAKTAYLHVPGEQKEVSASARRANRASGDLDTSGAMVHIIFEGETNTTGISTVDNDSVTVDDDAWYTLQGVRVEVPTKGGIYIHNGRKLVVK